MTALTPIELRSAVEDWLNEVDDSGREVDWTLADAKAEFERWIAHGREPTPFPWDEAYNSVMRDALTHRYQGLMIDGGRWVSP